MNANRTYQRTVRGFTPEAMALLEQNPWPGNVRELENCVRSAAILADDLIEPHHLLPKMQPTPSSAAAPPPSVSFDECLTLPQLRTTAETAERHLIERALLETKWNIAETARRLQVDYKTLYIKIRRFGLSRPSI